MNSLQASDHPDSTLEQYDSNGWAYADSRLCPEPNPEDDYGVGYGDTGCNDAGIQAPWPSGQAVGSGYGYPHQYFPGSASWYHELCGPGSATAVLYSWLPWKVAHYNGWVIKGKKNTFGLPTGWYRMFWREAYELMQWSNASAAWLGASYGWNTWWQGELKQFQHLVPWSTHRFVAYKDYVSSETNHAGAKQLTLQNFRNLLRLDLAVHKARWHDGALFAAVYTGNMPNWDGTDWRDYNPSLGGYNHYLSVDGYNKSAQDVQYGDTAASFNVDGPVPYGHYKVSDSRFLSFVETTKVAAENSHHKPIAYESDRVVIG